MSDQRGQIVNDAWVAASGDRCGNVGTAEQLHRTAEASPVFASGREQAGAVLTQAANAIRRATGQSERQAIKTSDDAFTEWEALRDAGARAERAGTPWPADVQQAASALEQGIDTAIERLGPLPGGRRASGGIVNDEVEPTDIDLRDIGHASGYAMGELHRGGHTSVVTALDELVPRQN